MRFPFFGNKQIPNMGNGFMQQASPFRNMQEIMQNINAIRQNPNIMGQFLYEHKMIDKQQFDELQRQGISGNPEAIGNYLMNRGAFTKEQLQYEYNNSALPIQNSMRQS